MNTKKILASVLSAAVLTLSQSAAFAAVGAVPVSNTDAGQVMPVNIQAEAQKQYFRSFTGTVSEISDHKSIAGAKFVSAEGKNGEEANIIITDDTYILNAEEIVKGSEITAYYDANAIMIMIYPPQYKAEVVVVNKAGRNVKTDRFDEELVSADNSLKLNISDETIIKSTDGKAFEGLIMNRDLVVVYGAATKSIPAQTTPTEIVVLPAAEVKVSGENVTVDDSIIEAPAAYTGENGIVMVPLRAPAEALGFEVRWNAEDRSVSLGGDIVLSIGDINYSFSKSEAAQFEAAPVIVHNRTFVPLSFFDGLLDR